MKYIDINQWSRKKHFEFFNRLNYPHFNLCANVDITKFQLFLKEHHLSFFKTMLYVAVRTANEIPEFRFRIRGDQIVEHESVHPNFTTMTDDNLFSFCGVDYTSDFQQFCTNVTTGINHTKTQINVEDEPDRDDLLYITSIPWVSFTSLVHPVHFDPNDSVPRIAWGKFFEENGLIKMPLSVQVHHALMDGWHVGRYFTKFQELLNNPQGILDKF